MASPADVVASQASVASVPGGIRAEGGTWAAGTSSSKDAGTPTGIEGAGEADGDPGGGEDDGGSEDSRADEGDGAPAPGAFEFEQEAPSNETVSAMVTGKRRIEAMVPVRVRLPA